MPAGLGIAIGPDCCEEPSPTSGCANCSTGQAPDQLQLVLAGITGSGAGGDCGTILNGTWVLNRIGIGEPCQWESSLYDNACAASGQSKITVSLSNVVGNYVLNVLIKTGDFGSITFEKNFGTTKPDCLDWSNEDIPFVSDTTCCDASLGSAKITSI